MRDRTYRSFLKRLALSLMLSALILPCAVVLLRFAVAKSQTAEPGVSSVPGTLNDRSARRLHRRRPRQQDFRRSITRRRRHSTG